MGQLLNPRNSREDSKSEKNAPELERAVAASSAMQTVPAESDMVFILVPPHTWHRPFPGMYWLLINVEERGRTLYWGFK